MKETKNNINNNKCIVLFHHDNTLKVVSASFTQETLNYPCS